MGWLLWGTKGPVGSGGWGANGLTVTACLRLVHAVCMRWSGLRSHVNRF